ncbi:MAG: hydantoinase B/oxoprolinase family protein [Planctomycetaceae bacterium]|nr:hydantoinase B/oxoprolinase family protein [Planctomycetaceae bacterium]
MSITPYRLEVFKNLLAGVAEEMGVVLGRSAYSVNIKERRDYSCAVFDGRGRMIAQAAHIPVHLGSMPLSVQAALRRFRFRPGDLVVLNDPYQGGTHLPDVTFVRPVFAGRSLEFFTASRAHYSDIGGMAPGSMPVSTDLYQEGLILPPVRLTPEVRTLLLANVRNPKEVEGDVAAQEACCETGARRLLELRTRYGRELTRALEELQQYARRRMIAAIRKIPAGRHAFEDELDDDGIVDRPIRIRAVVERRGDRVRVDFSGSDAQVAGNVNSVYAVTLSAVLYCFRCLVPDDIPLNAGAAEPIDVIAPEGCVVNARPPAAVTAGNVETSQRIVDVVFGALRKALPGVIPAASQGTMNNFSFGGAGFAYYETIAGGMGARPRADGVSGVHTHMTNTLNTPIEALEHAYPVRVTEYRFRPGSGGRGRFRGGDGVVREFEFLEPAQVSIVSDRRKQGPRGRPPGKPGRNTLNGRPLPGKTNFRAKAGDRVRIETPGGAGV